MSVFFKKWQHLNVISLEQKSQKEKRKKKKKKKKKRLYPRNQRSNGKNLILPVIRELWKTLAPCPFCRKNKQTNQQTNKQNNTHTHTHTKKKKKKKKKKKQQQQTNKQKNWWNVWTWTTAGEVEKIEQF